MVNMTNYVWVVFGVWPCPWACMYVIELLAGVGQALTEKVPHFSRATPFWLAAIYKVSKNFTVFIKSRSALGREFTVIAVL